MVGAWYNQLLIFGVDGSGNVTTNVLSLQDQTPMVDTAVDTLIAAYQAISGVSVFAAQKQITKQYSGVVTPGAYSTWADRAVFNMQGANKNANVGLVGPLSSIFLSDTITLNLSNTQVLAFIAALEAIIGIGPGGIPMTKCNRGYRTQTNPFNVAP